MQYKLAACQLSVTADKQANIAHAREKIQVAADQGAQLIVLPVSFLLIHRLNNPREEHKPSKYKSREDVMQMLIAYLMMVMLSFPIKF
jgi:predicted amidohydrolase